MSTQPPSSAPKPDNQSEAHSKVNKEDLIHSESQSQKKSDNSPHNPGVVKDWYAKTHLTHTTEVPHTAEDSTQQTNAAPPLNLSIFFRIWIAVGIIVIISGLLVFNQLFEYVKPTTQQAIEDTLVDTSKLLATSLQPALISGQLYDPNYQANLDSVFAPNPMAGTQPDNTTNTASSQSRYYDQNTLNNLSTWYYQKTHSSFRLYITDRTGKVIYDSLTAPDNAEGQDYSRWNDVHLTLQGQYGARTTRKIAEDPSTSVMYVAQPIKDSKGTLLGVVSVGKPTATIMPYIDATRQRMLSTSLIITALSLLLAGLVAWWLKQSIALVTRYTQSLAQETNKPRFYLARELNELTNTIDAMKHHLENRAYVTDYVHTLTHELKSPLTAIRASGELLSDHDLDQEDRHTLSDTITEQSLKLQSLIDRMLLLAKIEQPTFKLYFQPINIVALLNTLLADNDSKLQRSQITSGLLLNKKPINTAHSQSEFDFDSDTDEPASHIELMADAFWLNQALQNILDNAIHFAHSQIGININTQTHDRHILIEISNDGQPIPEYAISKVFERYFSLSHQQVCAGKKGSGLGLTLVKQVAERHGGYAHIHNLTQPTHRFEGVMVSLQLPKPASPSHS